MTLETRLTSLEKNATGSLTAGMTTEQALDYFGGLSPKDRAECVRRMTDEELERDIAYLQALEANGEAKRGKKR